MDFMSSECYFWDIFFLLMQEASTPHQASQREEKEETAGQASKLQF
jgi:hypothetical protein